MKTFTSISDLDQLADDDPAKPVVKQLLEWVIAPGDFPDHPYNPDDHGYIALVEPGDADRELDDIDMPRLRDPRRRTLDRRRAAGGPGIAPGRPSAPHRKQVHLDNPLNHPNGDIK
jgi:hypothetical protein